MNRIQLIFNEKWAMAREDYYNLVSLILPSIHSGNVSDYGFGTFGYHF